MKHLSTPPAFIPFIFSLLVVSASPLHAQENSSGCTPGRSSLQAILGIAQTSKLPLGLVLDDNKLCLAQCSPLATGSSPEAAIEELLLNSGYQFRQSGSTWVISPIDQNAFQSEILHHKLGSSFSAQATISTLGILLEGWVKSYVHPEQGWATSILGTPGQAETKVFEGPENTIEDALNSIVSKDGKGLWLMSAVTNPFAPDYENQQNDAVVRTYSYDYDQSALASITCNQKTSATPTPKQ